jgi:hypothetical protein
MEMPAESLVAQDGRLATEVARLVNPARTMGWFLRTWREDWAHLSRAQLALAISAHAPGRERTTPDMVRQWERGQPPHSSQQLTALLDAMARHGVPEDVMRRFLITTFAACAGHQYADLLGRAGLLERTDLDDIGRQAYLEQFTRAGPGPDLVTLVGIVRELEQAVGGDQPACDEDQLQRQAAALAGFRAALCMAVRSLEAPVYAYAPRLYLDNAELLARHFGPRGLGGPLSVLAQQVQAHTVAAHFGGSLPSARRLLALACAAEARGEPLVAGQARVRATHYLAELGEGDYGTMSREALACLARDERLGGVGYADFCQKDLAWAALSHDLNDEAVRRVTLFVDWLGTAPQPGDDEDSVLAWVAAAAGDLGTAEGRAPSVYEAALELKARGRPTTYPEWLCVRPEKTRRR